MLSAKSHPQFQGYFSRLGHVQLYVPDIPVIKLLKLLFGHFCTHRMDRIFQNGSDINAEIIQPMPQFRDYGGRLHRIAVARTEVIDTGVGDSGLRHGFFKALTALAALDHHQEICFCDLRDHAPIVGVAGKQNDGVHIVAIHLAADL